MSCHYNGIISTLHDAWLINTLIFNHKFCHMQQTCFLHEQCNALKRDNWDTEKRRDLKQESMYDTKNKELLPGMTE